MDLNIATSPRVVRLKASPAPLLGNLSSNGLHYAYTSTRRIHLVRVGGGGGGEREPALHTRVPYKAEGAVMSARWEKAEGKGVLCVCSTDALVVLDATGTQVVVEHTVGEDNVALFFSTAAVVDEWRAAGPVVLAGLSSGDIVVVDIASGAVVDLLHAHDSTVTAIVDIADEPYVVTADDAGRVVLWDADNAVPARDLAGGDGIPVTAMVSRIDTVVVACANGILRFFSISTPELMAEVHAHARIPTDLALLGSRGIVVSVGHDSCVYAFDFTDLAAITRVFAATVPDALFQGVTATARSIAVVAYDSHKLRIFE